jgi:O-antigen/teichoic acid export membrane protein
MQIIARQSVLTTISSYIGVVIGYVNLLWLFPYILSPQQIGTFKTIQDMGLLLVPFAQLGLGHGITRFYPQVKKHQNAFFTLGLAFTLLGFSIIAFLFFTFRQQIIAAYATNAPELIDYLSIVLFITLFATVNSVFDAFTRSFVKIAVPTFLREVLLRLLITCLVSAYFLEWLSFNWMIWGLAGAYLLTLLLTTGYMLKLGIFKIDMAWSVLPKKFQTEFLRYSLITLLGTAGAMLIMKIDSLMVSSMIGLDANAIYTIGFSIAVVIEMPRRAISQVAMPIISEKFASNLLHEIDDLYKKIAVHQSLVCILIFLLIWTNIDNLYHFVPNREVYEAGKWVVLLIGIGKLSDVLFSVNGEIIVFSRFYVFNITATLLMAIAVILLNLWLIPVLGLEGAALASLLAMIIYNLLKYFYIKLRLNFSPFSWDLFKTLTLGLAVFAFSHYILPNLRNVFLDIGIRSLATVGLFTAGIYLMKIAPSTQEMAVKKIKNLFQRTS